MDGPKGTITIGDMPVQILCRDPAGGLAPDS